MTMQPQEKWTIPEDTKRIAQAVFKKGNIYVKIADQLGQLYEDKEWIDLFISLRLWTGCNFPCTSCVNYYCSIPRRINR